MTTIINSPETSSPQRAPSPENPPTGLDCGLFSPEEENSEWSEEVSYPPKRPTDDPSACEFTEDEENTTGHQSNTKSKNNKESPPKTPTTELEEESRIYPGPSISYHTLLQLGHNTLDGFPGAPLKPDIFKGLKFSPGRDIAVGDIVYSKKRADEPNTDPPHSRISRAAILDHIVNDTSAPVRNISTLVSFTNPRVNETDISDNDLSLYPEPGTPRSSPITQASQTTRNPGSSDSINTRFGPATDPCTELRSLAESLVWGFGNHSDEAASEGNDFSLRHKIHQHGLNDKTTSPLQHDCQKFHNELLDIRKHALRSEKEMQKLETRVGLLEKRAGIKEKSRLAKKKRSLLARGGDAHTARVIQHINHLIELRKFVVKLKKTGLGRD